MRSSPGQTHTIEVDPRPYYVDTTIEVAAGETYDFAATGMWRDASEKCDANGWSKGIFARLTRFNRVPGRNYFELCGCLEKASPSNFPIGKALPGWKVPAGATGLRRLYLFANDWPIMYWNNHALPPPDGPLLATITRIA